MPEFTLVIDDAPLSDNDEDAVREHLHELLCHCGVRIILKVVADVISGEAEACTDEIAGDTGVMPSPDEAAELRQNAYVLKKLSDTIRDTLPETCARPKT